MDQLERLLLAAEVCLKRGYNLEAALLIDEVWSEAAPEHPTRWRKEQQELPLEEGDEVHDSKNP